MLSTRFPKRRGMAIAFHGAGSGAGEALSPLIVGLVLTYLLLDDWRLYTVLSMVPALAIGLVIYWMLSGAGPSAAPANQRPARLSDVFTMLRYPVYRSLAYMNFTRSFAHFGVLSFLPLNLSDDLGMNSAGVGLGVALLTLIGSGVGPLFGFYSDTIGRRLPMVTALVVMCLGLLAIGIVGEGILMFLALGMIGIFLWSVQDVTNATAMDAAPVGREGSVVGMMFSSSLLGGIIAPIVLALAINAFDDNRRVIFFVAAIVVAPAILVMSVAPLSRKAD
jgi:MFS family permease